MGVPSNNPPGVLPGNGSGTPAPGGGTLSNPLAAGFYQAYLAGNLPTTLDTNDNNASVISTARPSPGGRLVSILNETLLRDLKPEDDGSERNSRPYVYRPIPDSEGYTDKYLYLPAGDIAFVALVAGAGAAIGSLIARGVGAPGSTGAAIGGVLAGGIALLGTADELGPASGARIGLTTKDAVEAAKYSYDFPIRGGALAGINALDDFLRISRFLTDGIRGPLFIAKQVALQLMNPKIETGRVLGILGNNRFYNAGIGTLAQSVINPIGGHLDRHGLFNIIADEQKYFRIVQDKNKDDKNRLVLLYRTKFLYYDNNNPLLDGITDAGIAQDRNKIINYWGGPEAFLGIIGNTTIPRVTSTEFDYDGSKGSIKNIVSDDGDSIKYFAYLNHHYDIFHGSPSFDRGLQKKSITQDFRTTLNTFFKAKPFPSASDYINGPTRENRGTGINLSRLQKISSTDDLPNDPELKDQIRFSFESIEPGNISKSLLLLFPAYLNNFSDNISADWSSVKYTGRGENFWTYNSFNRTINFGFTIAAHKKEEMKSLYQKLNYLVSNLAPVYDTIFMSGPLMRITIGDYIYRQPGFFTSLNLSIDNNTPWEINLENSADMYQLPQVINVDASFTPIHTFLVRRSVETPYITPSKTDNSWIGVDTLGVDTF